MAKKGGQNKEFCKHYRATGRSEVNRTKRMIKVLNRNPSDKDALKCFNRLDQYWERAVKELKRTGFKGKTAFA